MPVAPPPPSDLPLNGLRAVEAAARLGGFAAAAADLGVTPGAVAAHVKGIEALLGAPLFIRDARGVRLTEVGARCLPSLTAAFDALGAAGHVLRSEAAPMRLSLACLPAIAQLWVQPRQDALLAAFPGLSLSITALEQPPATKRHGFDVTLFFGPGQDWLMPVAAPGRVEGPCLADAVWSGDWTTWRAGAGPAFQDRPTGPVHSLYALAIEDALAGRGVAMGRLSLVAGLLSQGRLVEVGPRVAFDQMMIARAVHPGRTARAVAGWLQRELS
ncbi:LysR family transcriptional regulator [Jannaschia sp. 2305UL9-9]|uniref:LysR family transcriptional regulator n=1 Tax=Jannaschia sp. 2305UL9-9 TaxID=3121638 RepID=UPI0035293044